MVEEGEAGEEEDFHLEEGGEELLEAVEGGEVVGEAEEVWEEEKRL